MVGFFNSEVLGSFGVIFIWFQAVKNACCYPWAYLYSDNFVFLYLCHIGYCPYRFPTITYTSQKEYLSHDEF